MRVIQREPIPDQGEARDSESPTIDRSAWESENDSDWLRRLREDGQSASFESRYVMLKQLGRGGTSEVYLMHDLRVGREVAAKVLRVDREVSPNEYSRFVHEASHQARLEHPSIVPVHDVGLTNDGRIYFTMKCVRGDTLSSVLKRLREGDAETMAKFTLHKLLSAFNTICLTVAFAHERGFIHRDIKPSNIMFGDFGETYVLDWGISRGSTPLPGEGTTPSFQVPLPLTQGTSGTPGYMAPEQVTSSAHPLTPAVDIYALGAVLFEILSLEPLHGSQPIAEVLKSTLNGADARPSVRAPHRDLPPELDALCVRATAIDPEARCASALELSQAIERNLKGDRDLELRRTLARAQLEAAEQALREAEGAEASDETGLLAQAMQAAGRALALEPRNEQALECIVRVLGQRPRSNPPELEKTLREREMRVLELTRRRWSVFGAALMMTLLPVALWCGVRDWVLLGAAFGALGLMVVTLAASSLLKRPPAWLSYLHLATAHGGCFLSGQAISSLYLSPTLFMLSTLAFAMGPVRRIRMPAVVLGALGGLLSLVLEATGVVTSSIRFTPEGLLCLIPRGVFYPQVPFLVSVGAVGTLLIVAPALSVIRLRKSEETADRQVLLGTWYLRQLLPRAVAVARTSR